MATDTKKRMRESKAAGAARLTAVGLRGIAVVLHTVAEVLDIFEKAARSIADALMDTIATEDK